MMPNNLSYPTSTTREIKENPSLQGYAEMRKEKEVNAIVRYIRVNSGYMPDTKASKGGEKTIVTINYGANAYPRNREVRIVFHHNMVYIKEIAYNKRSDIARRDISIVKHEFDMLKFGFAYDGSAFDAIEIANMALKMFTDKYILSNRDDELLIQYSI